MKKSILIGIIVAVVIAIAISIGVVLYLKPVPINNEPTLSPEDVIKPPEHVGEVVGSSENAQLTYGMIDYFANSSFYEWRNQNYYYILMGLINFDPSIPMSEQYISLGISYYDYFVGETITTINTYIKYYEAALADDSINFNELKLNAESYVAYSIADLEITAESQELSLSKYVQVTFGLNVTVEDLEKALFLEQFASLYSEIVNERIANSITDSDLNKYYDEHKGNLDSTVCRNVGHILFRVDSTSMNYYKTSDEAKAAATTLLAEMEPHIVDGKISQEKFAEFADVTHDTNVFYDNVSKGDMVAGFDDWLFSAQTVGEIGLVETNFGWHIIYYGGTTEPKWILEAREFIIAEKFAEWVNGLNYTVDIDETVFESIYLD